MTKNERVLMKALEMAIRVMRMSCRNCPCVNEVCGDNDECNDNLKRYFIRKAKEAK